MANQLSIFQLPQIINLEWSITYIGIGTYCILPWNEQNDQQYPIFIRKVKQDYPDININLILIDPCFSEGKIPTCLKDLSVTHDPKYSNVYHTVQNIHAYVFDLFVCYLPELIDCQNGIVDITNFFLVMNRLCQRNDTVLLVHDFSGADLRILALYFDSMIDKKHIIYDFSGRSDQPCLSNFDFLDCRVCVDTNNHIIELFNPFLIKYEQLIPMYHQSLSLHQMKTHYIIGNVIQFYKQMFFQVYLATLRRIINWQKSQQTNRDVEINRRIISIRDLKLIDHLHNLNLLKLYNQNGTSQQMIDQLLPIVIQKCREMSLLFQIDSDINVNFLTTHLQFPNLWDDYFNKVLSYS
ncbi:MAG: hypothetical protein ABIN35_01110 [candidate division WOR-3 bacterium]